MNDNTMSPKSPVEKQVMSKPTVSAVLPEGQLLELVYRPDNRETGFALWDGGNWSLKPDLPISETEQLIPYSPKNNLLQNEVVLLPSEPEEYGTEQTLLSEIQDYVHRYVDVSPSFEKISSYYVLLSWIYDNFNELPYLRLRGDPGSGKTRFLQTVGALCYKPIFASGASSVSPIFRILDSIKGTLVIDESDFRFSDEKAEMVKIFNNGNTKGFPVLRSEVVVQTKEFNPRAYHVFGPKLIATRGLFEDRALESRCLTEEMGQRKLREDIPINLPDSFKDEARHLRNKLLLFRFRNFGVRKPIDTLVDRTIEPRLNQIFTPLLSIVQDPEAIADIQELAKNYHRQMINERGMQIEAQVLEVIRELAADPESRLTVLEITKSFIKRYGEEYERRISAKYVGYILRGKLSLKPERTNQGYAIPPSDEPKLQRLYERYGLPVSLPQRSPSSRSSPSSAEQSEHGEHRELPEREESQPSPPNPPTHLPLET